MYSNILAQGLSKYSNRAKGWWFKWFQSGWRNILLLLILCFLPVTRSSVKAIQVKSSMKFTKNNVFKLKLTRNLSRSSHGKQRRRFCWSGGYRCRCRQLFRWHHSLDRWSWCWDCGSQIVCDGRTWRWCILNCKKTLRNIALVWFFVICKTSYFR